MLDQQIRAVEKKHQTEGGYREKLLQKRIAFRSLQRGFLRLTKKTLIFLLIFAILIPSLSLYFLLSPSPVSASWFDDTWSFRTSLTIGNTGSADSNKKVKFDIDTATLITNGQLQSDCGDSRFTDATGNLLAYYLDSAGGACNGASTDYYVLVPTIPTGNSVIYHYYGNPSAVDGTQVSQFAQSTFSPTSGPTAGTAEKAPSPVAYWKFDDATGTNAQDSSQNNLDGTLNNTPTWQTEDQCIAGKCLWFDGANNENVSKSDDAKLDFVAADNFTVQAWVKRNGASSANNFILTKAQSGYTGYKLYQDASGDYCFDVSDGTNTDTACTSAVEFDDDQWHLVQGVKTGTSNITLFVDGKQRAQDASIAATGTLANTGTFYTGVDLDGTSNEWLGFIDEVKVYSYARTAAQIASDYISRGTSKGSALNLGNIKINIGVGNSGPVGYWRMDEKNGTSAFDSSGNANTGTLTSGPTWTTGKYGAGINFDGSNDYITVPYNSILDLPTGGATIEAWIYLKTVTTPTGDARIAILKRIAHSSNESVEGAYEFEIYQAGSSPPGY